MTIKLTDQLVAALPLARTPDAAKQGHGSAASYTIGDAEQPGLAIKVGLRLKVWQVAVRPLGAGPTKEKLGNWLEDFIGRDQRTGEEKIFQLNVANARANARIRLAAMREGRKPGAEKREANRKRETENRETLRWLITKHQNEWMKKGADGKPKKNSLKGIETALIHVADWLDRPFREITPDMVLERFNQISAEKNKQGKPKKTTANNVFRDLRTVFNNWLALRPDEGFRNPTEVLARKRHKMTPRKNWINTRDEGGQFVRWWRAVEAEENPTVRDYFKVTLLQGARETETARLEWSHLDFGARIVHYRETKNGEDYAFPMTPAVHAILLARQADPQRHAKWVFPAARIHRAGMPLNHISAPPADAIRRIAERADVKWAMHDLRRTYANTLMMLGVDGRERDYMLKHLVQGVSVHYEDLAITLAQNLGKYENRLLALLDAANAKDEQNGGTAA